MDKVTSRDGTQIACWSAGSGPPLLLVHGGMQDHTRWAEVSAPFEQRFTVYTIDRRGRGESGDGPDYSLERECDDLLAVLDFIRQPTAVLGHSYGADIALMATLETDGIDRLILYEPGILEGVTGYYSSDCIVSSLRSAERQLQAEEPEAAIVTILREIIEVPDEVIETMKSMPAWPGRVASAHTIAREIQSEGSWKFNANDYREMRVPTLLLTGSESYQIARDGTAALHEVLPNSRVVEMEGQGHAAMTTAPGLFVGEVLAFLAEP